MLITEEFYGDDERGVETPLSPAERDYTSYVEALLTLFGQVSGENGAQALSLALYRLKERPLHPLTAEYRERLLWAASRAHVVATAIFPEGYGRARLAAGFDAAVGLIVVWSECFFASDNERRSADEVADLEAYVQILANDARNLALADAIEKRAETRSAAVSAELRAWGLRRAA